MEIALLLGEGDQLLIFLSAVAIEQEQRGDQQQEEDGQAHRDGGPAQTAEHLVPVDLGNHDPRRAGHHLAAEDDRHTPIIDTVAPGIDVLDGLHGRQAGVHGQAHRHGLSLAVTQAVEIEDVIVLQPHKLRFGRGAGHRPGLDHRKQHPLRIDVQHGIALDLRVLLRQIVDGGGNGQSDGVLRVGGAVEVDEFRLPGFAEARHHRPGQQAGPLHFRAGHGEALPLAIVQFDGQVAVALLHLLQRTPGTQAVQAIRIRQHRQGRRPPGEHPGISQALAEPGGNLLRLQIINGAQAIDFPLVEACHQIAITTPTEGEQHPRQHHEDGQQQLPPETF